MLHGEESWYALMLRVVTLDWFFQSILRTSLSIYGIAMTVLIESSRMPISKSLWPLRLPCWALTADGVPLGSRLLEELVMPNCFKLRISCGIEEWRSDAEVCYYSLSFSMDDC